MDRHITVTSTSQNPANFVSNFTESVAFGSGYEVGLKGIFHAPIHNVTDKNNTFKVKSIVKRTDVIESYTIPPGFYIDSCHILQAIKQALDDAISVDAISDDAISDDAITTSAILRSKPEFKYKAGGEQAVLKLRQGVFFYVDSTEPQLLHLLGFCVQGEFGEININVFKFPSTLNSGFLYSSIVGNSIIDQKQSRILSIVPMASKNGYNYHEFMSPVYNPKFKLIILLIKVDIVGFVL